MGLFDSLRSKLKGVSKKLESEVEKQLGDQVERELAAALEKEQGAKEVPAPSTPPRPPTPSPPPAAPTPTPPPPASAPAAPPTLPSAPAPPTPPPPATPLTPPTTQSPVTPTHSAPSATVPTSPAAPGPVTLPATPPPGAPEHASAPVTPPAPPAAPTRPSPPEVSPPGQSAQSVARPGPAPSAPQQPKPAPPAPAARPQQPHTGRKMLSEAEIEKRLEMELSAAVGMQKEVERTVKESAPAARFTINESVLEDILWDLEVGLLESDVALPVIEAIKANVKEQLLTLPVGGRPEEVVERVLRTAIERVLEVNPLDFDRFVRERLGSGKRPVVLMFVGVNGTGKTTSIGRIAYRLKQQGISCVMAAGDTFRAGAIEQLSLHGERLGVTVVKHKAGADPAAVAYDAIEHAKARQKDVVLLDTAGRMQNNSNLMDEMDKIRRVANPDLCIFVGDSLAGNDAVEQARRFDQVVDVGGVILTKVDVDAKGGAALSVAYTIRKPLLFVGVGQSYPDLRPFDAKWLVDRLFGSEEATEAAAAAA